MIRFLHSTFILCFIIAISAPNVVAQSNIVFTAQKSAEKIIDSYGGFNHAVINMTRDEWDIVRAWEGFDENAYLETISSFKASFSDDREKRKANRQAKVLQSDCNCWVEPDDSYTTMVPPPGLGGLQPGEEQWSLKEEPDGMLIVHQPQFLFRDGPLSFMELYMKSFT